MAKGKVDAQQNPAMPIHHGAVELPLVTVDSYNLELRDKDGFIGDKANKSAFIDFLDDWRKLVGKSGHDPFGETKTSELSKKDIDKALTGPDRDAAALILSAIDDFARQLAKILKAYMRQKAWKDTQRVMVGGGFKQSAAGELAIARASLLLQADGLDVTLQPIHHHPDDAGLIGAAHLMPSWMLKGHQAMIAVDIGGTNVRAGIVKLNSNLSKDLSKAEVWKSEIWRHADDDPSRSGMIEQLVDMIRNLIAAADKEKFEPAPVIGVACPGIIEADGSIKRGGQNLPGGNWESETFNLAVALKDAIPEIDDHETFVIIHNDAVVQGLSQIPFMQDVDEWGVVTIGTGLGNARFTNKR